MVATIAFSAPQNAAVLPGAWLYNGDQIRKPYYAIEEVYFCVLYIIYKENLIIFLIQNDICTISFYFVQANEAWKGLTIKSLTFGGTLE